VHCDDHESATCSRAGSGEPARGGWPSLPLNRNENLRCSRCAMRRTIGVMTDCAYGKEFGRFQATLERDTPKVLINRVPIAKFINLYCS
jgi:hypothetical protein